MKKFLLYFKKLVKMTVIVVLTFCMVIFSLKSVYAAVTVTISSLGAGAATPGNGLSGSPVASTQTNVPIYGFSLSGTGTGARTITSLTFESGLAVPNNQTFYFSTISLYSSTGSTFPGVGNPGATFICNGTNSTYYSTFTLPTSISITNSTPTLFYFLVISNTVNTTTTNYSIDYNNNTGGGNFNTSGGPNGGATGFIYTFSAPVGVMAANLTGLTSGPAIYPNQTNIAVAGISLKTTSSTTTLSQLTFTVSAATAFNYFANPPQIVTSGATFTTGTPVSGATVSVSGTTITCTIPNAPVSTTTTYYYLVVNYTVSGGVTPQSFTFAASGYKTALNASAVTTGYAANTYTCTSPYLAENTTTAGLAANPISGNQSNIAIFGFSAAANGAAVTITSLSFTASQTISNYFPNIALYSSANPSFPGTGSATLVSTQSSPATAAITFGSLTQNIPSGSTLYYYLVVSYTETGAVAPAAFQFNLNTITTTTTVNYSNKTGTNYTFSAGGFDWIGGAGSGATLSDWNTAANWYQGSVPGSYDVVNIGVGRAFTYIPTISSGISTVSTITFGGNFNGSTSGLTVNGASLIVNGDISAVGDANCGGYDNQFYLTGTGTNNIQCNNINVNSSYAAGAFNGYTMQVINAGANIAVGGNVILTSTSASYIFGLDQETFNSKFLMQNGITTVAGLLKTVNSNGAATSTITFSGATAAAPATLQLANAAALSFSATGTNAVNFNVLFGTVEYSGSAQTVFTDAAITGLTPGPSYYSLKFSGTGAKTPNGGNINIAGSFTNSLTNDASNYITLTGNPVFFNGTSVYTQSLAGGAGTGTTFKNVTFTGAAPKTMISGKFNVISTGLLTLNTNAKLTAGDNNETINSLTTADSYLTMQSDINGAATVAAIPPGCSVTGNVNVQRYITGGAANYRGYRLLSSPVTVGAGVYSLNYVHNTCYLTSTSGAANGFDGGANPTLYLFRENLVPSNTSFISGNFRGINNISTSPTYSLDGEGINYQLPVGAGFLMFYRGDKGAASYASETTPSYVPTPATLTATGLLNQGQVTAKDWYNSSSSNLGFTTTSGTATVEGFNLAGNPYASSINWDTYNTTSSTTGIYAPNTTGFVYVLDSKSKNYNVYQAGKSGAGTIAATGSNIIPSGQGFFVVASNTSAQLIFNESAKINTQANAASGNLFLALQQKANAGDDHYMHLELIKDSLSKDGILINFNALAKSIFDAAEDAPYKVGNGWVSLGSKSADGITLAINATPYPVKAQPIALVVSARTDGTYSFNMDVMKNIPDAYDIWLKDAYRKDSLDIKHNPTYVFNIIHADTNTYGASRFSLIIRQDPGRSVHLLNFIAGKGINTVKTVWTVENEENYTSFNLQKSTDGLSFATIDTLISSGLGTYSFTDEHPQNTNYYRLQMTSVTGNVIYSAIVPVMYSNTAKTNSTVNIYPNPTNSMINIAVNQATIATSGLQNQTVNTATPATTTGAGGQTYDIKITNMTGEVLKTVTAVSSTWQNNVSSLLPGTYIIQVLSHGSSSIVGRATFVKL